MSSKRQPAQEAAAAAVMDEATIIEHDATDSPSGTSFTTTDRDMRLIQAVRGHAVIYDPRYVGYKDPRVKDQTWRIISTEIGATPDDCRNRWRSLRDRFVREKKALLLGHKEQGTAAGRRNKTWSLLEPMTFLWEFIMHRSRRGTQGEGTWVTSLTDEQLVKIENTDAKYTPGDEDVCLEDEEEASFEWIAVPSEEAPSEPKRMRTESSPSDMPVVTSASSLAHVQQPASQSQQHESHDDLDDEDLLFCKSVAFTLRRLAPRRKALAKLRVLQALYDAEFGSDVGPDVEVRLRKDDA